MARTRRQRVGGAAEALARRHLEEAGLRLVAANFRCRSGELDLVMSRDGMLVVVEVRYRGPGSRIGAAESITAAKQRRIVSATEYFLMRHPGHVGSALRFDVVCIDRGEGGGTKLQWLQDAFRPA